MNQRESIHERISETRKDKNLSQKKLCKIAGISATQLSRIENGITENVSSDVLIKLAITLDVSTDYLLCLTELSSPKNYEIGQLGLSEGAVRAIVSSGVNINALNALLENDKFSEVLRLTYAYFMDSISVGIIARNDIINFATAQLSDFAKVNPNHIPEVKKDIRHMKPHKIGEHEAETEKIKSLFMVVLKEIKKETESTTKKHQNVNDEMLQRILSESKKQKPKTRGKVAELIANAIQQRANISDEQAEDFKQYAERFL